MMSSYVDFARANRGLFNLMTGPRIASRNDYPELGIESARSFAAFANALASYAQACKWGQDDLSLVAHGAWAMEHGLATLILSDRIPRPDMPIDVDATIRFAIQMYLSAIKAGPGALRVLFPA
jgi:hypothetical protein